MVIKARVEFWIIWIHCSTKIPLMENGIITSLGIRVALPYVLSMTPGDGSSQEEVGFFVFFPLIYPWGLISQARTRMTFLSFLPSQPSLLRLQVLLFYYGCPFLVHSGKVLMPQLSAFLATMFLRLQKLVFRVGKANTRSRLLIEIHSAVGGFLNLTGDLSDSSDLVIEWEILVETTEMIGTPIADMSPMNPHWYVASCVIANILLEVGVEVFNKYARSRIRRGEIDEFGSFDYLNVIRSEFFLTEELFPTQNVNLAVRNLLVEERHEEGTQAYKRQECIARLHRTC
jgi:hypothetical protein